MSGTNCVQNLQLHDTPDLCDYQRIKYFSLHENECVTFFKCIFLDAFPHCFVFHCSHKPTIETDHFFVCGQVAKSFDVLLES